MGMSDRFERAEKLLIQRDVYKRTPVEAWRAVIPSSRASDQSAEVRFYHEIRWYKTEQKYRHWLQARSAGMDFADALMRHAEQEGDLPAFDDAEPPAYRLPAEAAKQPTPRNVVRLKLCTGVDGLPCPNTIPARRKRCPICAKENRRLQRQGYNQRYYQNHCEDLKAKRRSRYSRERLLASFRELIATRKAERERIANLPRLVPATPEAPAYFYDPKTGTREPLQPRRYQGWSPRE